jgi:2,4-dienoyl-CoA reductase-like NADH-dependent reductase (Old Yellow Enzyme family)/thioredoxin reductase
MDSLTSLFTVANIGTMQMQNRIIMAPMGTLFANEDGTVSERTCRYYEERAKGGAGLIIVEVTAISPEGKGHNRILRIHGDEFIPGLKRLVESVHRHGVPICLQIYHAGRQTTVESAGGQPVAPSAIPCPFIKAMPRELTLAEIEQLEDAFAEGARRAREAGFDAIEIHGAHGYLICQFLSVHSNIRTDIYGGGLENRMRFALNIVAKAKQKVGADFPMLFRLSAREYVPDGLDLDETRILAQRLEAAGIHCLDVSAGNYESMQTMIQPGWLPRGYLVPLAEEIKKVVRIPITVAGRINNPVLADEIIDQGKADFISLGRPLLADPEYPNKAREGRGEDIRKCTACYHCIDTEVGSAKPLSCAINAAAGNEAESILVPATKSKTVVVVGGGPAGMEAARVAATRGHKVTLFEQTKVLGGQLNIASVPPGKEELSTTIKYLATQLINLGVEIKIGQKATLESIDKVKPDTVIIATGSNTVLPEIEGAELLHVALARDVLYGTTPIGSNVVIIGGGRVGCETAEFLSSQGKHVTLVRMSGHSRLAGDIGPVIRRLFLSRLRQTPIKIEADSHAEKITIEGVVINKNGQSVLIKADNVVLSPRPVSDCALANKLKVQGFELYNIGDASTPRTIADAIHEGYKVGSKV